MVASGDLASRRPPVTVIDAGTPVPGRAGRGAAPAAGADPRPLPALAPRLGSLVLSLVVAGLVLWAARSVRPVDTPASLLLAGARVAGLIGGVLLFVQIGLMSRLRWLDRRLGTVALHVLHRDLGGMLIVAVLSHAILVLEGTALRDRLTPVVQLRRWLGTPELLTAVMAALILLALGLLAVRAVREVLPYEVWYVTHLASYAVLVLAFAHEYVGGSDLAQSVRVRTMWTVLSGVTIAAVLWGRVIAPLRLNLRHRLRVAAVRTEGPDAFSIYVTGRSLDRLPGEAGQFFRWRFLAAGRWSQSHPFSLSAAPNGRWLRCTVTMVGDHTAALRTVRPGTRVLITGPSGTSTPAQRTRRRTLLIAGGAGIVQVRALLEGLPPGAVLIYRARSRRDVIFDRELAALAHARSASVVYVLGHRDDPGPASALSPGGLRQIVPDLRRRDVYVCCSEGLTEEVVAILTALRLPRRQLHVEPFAF